MLSALTIHNLALIKKASLAFSPGLTCITGESGSGKTAFLRGIQLASGERAQSDWVRSGEDALKVEAAFYQPGESEDTIVSRTLSKEGRGHVEIDGELANAKMLSATVGKSIDFCGQHEHQKLLTSSGQRHLLLAYGADSLAPLYAEYKTALCAWKEAVAQYEEAKVEAEAGEAVLEDARFKAERIGEVNPQPGELEALEEELVKLESAEALFMAAEGARATIAEEDGAVDMLNAALSELRRASEKDKELAAHSETLQGLILELDDLASEFRAYRDGVHISPSELAEKQERAAELQSLVRTFGPTYEVMLETWEQAEHILAAYSERDEILAKAKADVDAAFTTLSSTAKALFAAEKTKAEALGSAITEKLSALEMGQARVTVEIELLESSRWGDEGPCSIEFLYTPGKNMAAHPLRRIASGGELSRVMLAAKAVDAGSGDADTLVFDEVDAGVGGTAAVALAKMLKEISKTHQVICVTHLPQVAVTADVQFVVTRAENSTIFVAVDGVSREREIARMLAGSITQESLAHAKSLLQ